MNENAKTKIEHAREVLSECQGHADEEWMVRHLAIVMAHITEAIAQLEQKKQVVGKRYTARSAAELTEKYGDGWVDELQKLMDEKALADLQALPETMLEKGQALKQFRLDVLNMGLRRFAEWIGLRPSYLANVEHGRAYWQTPEIDEKGNITTPDQQAPQGEFTKGLREHLSLITPNLVLKAEYDVPPESLTEFLAEVKEACDRLDRQAEERKRLQFDYERAINIYRLGSW